MYSSSVFLSLWLLLCSSAVSNVKRPTTWWRLCNCHPLKPNLTVRKLHNEHLRLSNNNALDIIPHTKTVSYSHPVVYFGHIFRWNVNRVSFTWPLTANICHLKSRANKCCQCSSPFLPLIVRTFHGRSSRYLATLRVFISIFIQIIIMVAKSNIQQRTCNQGRNKANPQKLCPAIYATSIIAQTSTTIY